MVNGGGRDLDRIVRERPGGDDLAIGSGFLADFAEDGLNRILVRVDVAAWGHPPAEFGVLDEQDAVLMQHYSRGGEVADHEVTSVRAAMAWMRSAMNSTWLTG
jgi:hypothetical protein